MWRPTRGSTFDQNRQFVGPESVHLDFEPLTENNEREKDLDIHNTGVITLAERRMYLARIASSFELKPTYRN